MPAKMTLLPGHSTKLSVSTEDDSPELTRYFGGSHRVHGFFFCTYYLETLNISILIIKLSSNYTIFIKIPNSIYDYIVNSLDFS